MTMRLSSGEVVLIHKDRACAIVSVHPRSSNDRPLRVRSMCQRAPVSTAQVDSATCVRAALPSLPQARPSLSDRISAALLKANRSLIPLLEGPDSLFHAFSRIFFNCGGHELELRRQAVATLSQDFASQLSAKVAKKCYKEVAHNWPAYLQTLASGATGDVLCAAALAELCNCTLTIVHVKRKVHDKSLVPEAFYTAQNVEREALLVLYERADGVHWDLTKVNT